jgi:hypothetical protein
MSACGPEADIVRRDYAQGATRPYCIHYADEGECTSIVLFVGFSDDRRLEVVWFGVAVRKRTG